MSNENSRLDEAVGAFLQAVEQLGSAPGYIDQDTPRYKAAVAAASAVLGLPIQHLARWPQPSACSKVIVVDREGLCLIGRRAEFMENGGTWSFPAGFLDPGETPEEAGRRELREEAGIDIGNLPDVPDAIRCFWYSDKTTAKRWIIESTWVIVLDGVEARPSQEMTEWRWVDPRSLQEMLADGRIADLETDAVGLAVMKSRGIAPHRWMNLVCD
jgi:ADP-ribose pyrophosphatase